MAFAAVEPAEVPLLVASVALLAVAAWTLRLGPRHRLNRALALLLASGASSLGAGALSSGLADTGAWQRLAVHATILMLVLAIHFGVAYAGYLRDRPAPSWLLPVLVASTLPLHALYALDPWRWYWAPGLFEARPISIVDGLAGSAWAVPALLAGLAATRLAQGTRRTAALLLAAGLGVNAAYASAFVATRILAEGVHVATIVGWRSLAYAAALPLVAALALVAARARAWGLAVALSFAAVAGGAAGAYETATGTFLRPSTLLAWAGAVVAAPALAAYALARHQLFGADLRGRRWLSGGLAGGLLVGVVFIATESVAAYLGPRVGTFAAILAAGALVVAFVPTQRLVERLAGHALPGKPLRDMTREERLAAYREQLAFAWADGTLTARERVRLETLRERLGVAPEEAAALDVEAARAAPGA